MQVSPEGEDGETASVTVPVNPFRAVRVIVDVACEPAEIWGLGVTGPADIMKSEGARTVRDMVTE